MTSAYCYITEQNYIKWIKVTTKLISLYRKGYYGNEIIFDI
jgi:hypothetical protein